MCTTQEILIYLVCMDQFITFHLFAMGPSSPKWDLESTYEQIFVISFHILTIFGHQIANGDTKNLIYTNDLD